MVGKCGEVPLHSTLVQNGDRGETDSSTWFIRAIQILFVADRTDTWKALANMRQGGLVRIQ